MKHLRAEMEVAPHQVLLHELNLRQNPDSAGEVFDIEVEGADAEAASQWLIREKSIVVVPCDDAGPHLRFSVTYEAPTESDEKAYMERFAGRLAGIRFRF